MLSSVRKGVWDVLCIKGPKAVFRDVWKGKHILTAPAGTGFLVWMRVTMLSP